MSKMRILINRTYYTAQATMGELFIDGQKFCYTLEDTARPHGIKVSGDTCIPEGEYYIKLTMSSRFKRELPMIYTEPNEYEILKGGIGFKGVRIHRGNTHVNTHGCVLVGEQQKGNMVLKSKLAEIKLIKKIKDNGGYASLLIVNNRQDD
jgi:hypothetical protein